jgi:hypothetical protein
LREFPASEEVASVGLGEGPETLVGVPLVNPSASSALVGFDNRAGRCGECIRADRTRPRPSQRDELRERRLFWQQARDEVGEFPEVVQGINDRPRADSEISDVRVAFAVEQHVG